MAAADKASSSSRPEASASSQLGPAALTGVATGRMGPAALPLLASEPRFCLTASCTLKTCSVSAKLSASDSVGSSSDQASEGCRSSHGYQVPSQSCHQPSHESHASVGSRFGLHRFGLGTFGLCRFGRNRFSLSSLQLFRLLAGRTRLGLRARFSFCFQEVLLQLGHHSQQLHIVHS